MFLYFTSALGGNLFSGIANPKAIGVGASTAVFGLVGFYLAYLLTNFTYMGRRRYGQRWCLLFFVVILVLVNLLAGSHSDSHIDNYAHLGGFITGFFAGLAITEFFDYQARKYGRVPDRYTAEEYEFLKSSYEFFNWIYTSIFGIWLLVLIIYYFAGVKTDFEYVEYGDD